MRNALSPKGRINNAPARYVVGSGTGTINWLPPGYVVDQGEGGFRSCAPAFPQVGPKGDVNDKIVVELEIPGVRPVKAQVTLL